MERKKGVSSSVVEPPAAGRGSIETDPPEWTKAFPYDRLEPAHITELLKQTIDRCNAIVEQILNSTTHTFESILAPVNELHDTIFLAGGYLAQWLVNPDEAVRTAAREAEIELWHFYTDLFYDEDFYKKYKTFADTYEGRHLSGEKNVLSEMTGTDFHYAGQTFSRAKRDQLRDLDHELLEREIEFDFNLLNDQTTVELPEAEIEGISDRFKETLQRNPRTGNYVVTMDYPTFYPFMRQVSSRAGRRKVAQAFFSRAGQNAKLLDEIVSIRREVAELMGRKSWAHVALRNNMAKSVEEIFRFYDSLIEPLTVAAKEEVALMTGMLLSDGHKGPLRAYDVDYYGDQVVRRQYGIDHEKVAEYFPLDTVVNGLFDITGQLFNVNYRPVDAPTWHPDVQAYAIEDRDTGQEIATFYFDLFPREGKYQHACVVSLVSGREMPDKTYRHPQAVIIANYTPPTAEEPSLLSQTERVTHYHEFGHILHECLTRAKYSAMSGLKTEIDMAEVPSQAMEFWAWEPELITKHSRHYRTGKPMPASMAERLAESRKVNVALKTLEFIRKGMFDLVVHLDKEAQSVRQVWRDISTEIGVIPPQPGTYFPATFGHIASSGYAANYLGYERVMPICADIFERFRGRGLTNPDFGMEYRRKVLEPGYRQNGTDTIKNFLGKVDNHPYLRNLGLTAIALK